MKVYGDHLLSFLQSAYKEISEKEDEFCLDETGELYQLSTDIGIYVQLKQDIQNLIGLLEVDEIRGSTAIDIFRSTILRDPIQDLFYRLVESGEYPKVWELYDYDEGVE